VTQIGAEYGRLNAVPARQRTQAQKARMVELARDMEVARKSYDHFFARLKAAFGGRGSAAVRAANLPGRAACRRPCATSAGRGDSLYRGRPDDFHVILITEDAISPSKPQARDGRGAAAPGAGLPPGIAESRIDPRDSAKRLYNIIFCGGKVRQALEGANIKTLMWEPGRRTALRADERAARWGQVLGRELRAVGLHPGLARAAGPGAKAAWTALGLGVSKAHPNFQALPGVLEEMKAIIQPQAQRRERRTPMQWAKSRRASCQAPLRWTRRSRSRLWKMG
jgi:hypothetical protein